MVNIDKIKDGDAAEIERLMEEFTPQVVILSYKLSHGKPEHREDMVQAGLLALVEAAERYDGEKGAGFTTFALLCVKRRMIDELRRLTRYDGMRTDLEAVRDLTYEADTDADIMKRDILRDLPDILSAAELRVFFLKMRGASYAEIAAAMNIGEKAVDNALKRARKKIVELYNAG